MATISKISATASNNAPNHRVRKDVFLLAGGNPQAVFRPREAQAYKQSLAEHAAEINKQKQQFREARKLANNIKKIQDLLATVSGSSHKKIQDNLEEDSVYDIENLGWLFPSMKTHIVRARTDQHLAAHLRSKLRRLQQQRAGSFNPSQIEVLSLNSGSAKAKDKFVPLVSGKNSRVEKMMDYLDRYNPLIQNSDLAGKNGISANTTEEHRAALSQNSGPKAQGLQNGSHHAGQFVVISEKARDSSGDSLKAGSIYGGSYRGAQILAVTDKAGSIRVGLAELQSSLSGSDRALLNARLSSILNSNSVSLDRVDSLSVGSNGAKMSSHLALSANSQNRFSEFVGVSMGYLDRTAEQDCSLVFVSESVMKNPWVWILKAVDPPPCRYSCKRELQGTAGTSA